MLPTVRIRGPKTATPTPIAATLNKLFSKPISDHLRVGVALSPSRVGSSPFPGSQTSLYVASQSALICTFICIFIQIHVLTSIIIIETDVEVAVLIMRARIQIGI